MQEAESKHTAGRALSIEDDASSGRTVSTPVTVNIVMADRRVTVKTRNVSIGHGCPRYCQIHINRELSLTKCNNS